LYVALVLIGLRAQSKSLIIWGSALGSILNIVGFLYSPPGGELWKVIINRALSIFVIWITAILCLWQNRAEKNLRRAHDDLDLRVKDRTTQLNETNLRLQRESSFLQLLKDIAIAANETEDIQKTMRTCLKQICTHARWPVGHLYLPEDRSSKRLVPTPIWYLEDLERFETFRKITEATPFDPGVGLPGRVLKSGNPAWIIDVTEDGNFPRTQLAENIGVKAGFAFPILIRKDVVGVMEFFSTDTLEPDPEMLETMAQVGTLLGRIIERARAREDQEHLLGSLRERVKELTAMYDVANLVQTSKTMTEVFQKVESLIVPGMQYPEITRVRGVFEGKPFGSRFFDETPWKLSGNISTNGETRGVLEIFYTEPRRSSDSGPFLKEEQNMIDGLSRLLSVAAEHKRAEEQIKQSREQLRKLYHRFELIREEERTRIAREVHDELAQVLTALKLEVSLLDQNLENPKLKSKTTRFLQMIDNTIQAGKKIVMDLRPPVLDDLGLQEAIEWQGKEFQNRTKIVFDSDLGDEDLSLDIARATTLFRIFQETLTNVLRHAQASRVHVRLINDDKTVILTVRDNGIGATASQVENIRSLGILGMRERALVWGGSVDIQGSPGQGTSVTIRIKKEKP
jgi:signal transduction histidine kinase